LNHKYFLINADKVNKVFECIVSNKIASK